MGYTLQLSKHQSASGYAGVTRVRVRVRVRASVSVRVRVRVRV